MQNEFGDPAVEWLLVAALADQSGYGSSAPPHPARVNPLSPLAQLTEPW